MRSRVSRTLDDRQLLQLVGRVYGAALGEEPWAPVLADLGRAAGGDAVTLFAIDPAQRQVLFQELSGIDPADWARYERDYIGIDVRLEPLAPLPVGRAVLDGEVLPRERYLASAVYNEFYGPVDFPHMAAFVAESTTGVHSVLAVQGRRRRGPFDRETTRVLDEFAPHVRRALRLKLELARAAQGAALPDLLGGLDRPALVVDADARVRWANEAGRRLLVAGHGLASTDGGLRAAPAAVHRELRRRIAMCRSPALGGLDARLRPVTKDGPAPWELVVAPLPEAMRLAFTPGSCALVLAIADPAARPVDRLARRYALTRRETEVAIALANGERPREIAARLGRSYETVRSQLKSCYRKLAVRTQSELVRRVLVPEELPDAR